MTKANKEMLVRARFSRHHDVLSRREMVQMTRMNEGKAAERVTVAANVTVRSLAAGGSLFLLISSQKLKGNQVHLLQGSSTQWFLITRGMSFCSSSQAQVSMF
jgi:hypothetical protein